jgi:APA family basic amino acid/polyamine antiporter
MSPASSPAGPSRSLVRGLTLVPAAAIIITNVIGTGVFVKARVMTATSEPRGWCSWPMPWPGSLLSPGR